MAIYGKALRDQRRLDRQWDSLSPQRKSEIAREKQERAERNQLLADALKAEYLQKIAAGMPEPEARESIFRKAVEGMY